MSTKHTVDLNIYAKPDAGCEKEEDLDEDEELILLYDNTGHREIVSEKLFSPFAMDHIERYKEGLQVPC